MTQTTELPKSSTPGPALVELQQQLERMHTRMDELLADSERHWHTGRVLRAACDAAHEALVEPDPLRACAAALVALGEALDADLLEVHRRGSGDADEAQGAAPSFDPYVTWTDPARPNALGSLAWAVYAQSGWLTELGQNRHVAVRTDRAPPDFCAALDAGVEASFFVVPIRAFGVQRGALLAACRKLGRRWTNVDEAALRTVASACGAVLARADAG